MKQTAIKHLKPIFSANKTNLPTFSDEEIQTLINQACQKFFIFNEKIVLTNLKQDLNAWREVYFETKFYLRSLASQPTNSLWTNVNVQLMYMPHRAFNKIEFFLTNKTNSGFLDSSKTSLSHQIEREYHNLLLSNVEPRPHQIKFHALLLKLLQQFQTTANPIGLKNWLVYGELFSGKTYLLAAFINELAQIKVPKPQISVYMCTFNEIIQLLPKLKGFTDGAEAVLTQWETLNTVKILVIDDVFDTAINIDAICSDMAFLKLLQSRVNKNLTTIAISNYLDLNGLISKSANPKFRMTALPQWQKLIEHLYASSENKHIVSVKHHKIIKNVVEAKLKTKVKYDQITTKLETKNPKIISQAATLLVTNPEESE